MYDKWWKLLSWFDDKSIDFSEWFYILYKGVGWSRRIYVKKDV